MHRSQKKYKSGFTLIEVVISVLLISIAITAIFSAFSVARILTAGTSDRLIAAYLAQEGMEIVRNIRDGNWVLNGRDNWLDNLDCPAPTGCEADYTSSTMAPAGENSLYTNNVTGFYTYNSTNALQSKFMRRITITRLTDIDDLDDHIVKVKVEVSWKQKGNILFPGREADSCYGDNCVIVEDVLYNWF